MRSFLTLFRDAFILLRKNDPLRMAGATAFFTTFALPPIVFILAQLFGVFIGRRTMGRQLMHNITATLGDEGAEQVRQVIRSIRGFNDNWYIIALGFIFLLFVATTLFAVIRKSLDQLWLVSVKDKAGFLFGLRSRARSLGIILVAGMLVVADLLLESVGVLAGNYLEKVWSAGSFYLESILSKLGSVLIITIWFILLFRFLADGRPRWRACVWGGLLTGVLFTAGRMLLRLLLDNSNIGVLYGSSGSFVLILLFVFYSAFILYYGACFIAVYSVAHGWPVTPGSKAVGYTILEDEEDSSE